MKQSNSFVESMSFVCALTNIGLFLFALITQQPELMLVSLINVTMFLIYFLIWGYK